MTRDQAERVIERLADKTLNFGCVIILDGIPVTIVHKNYAGNFLTTWDVGNVGITRTVLERKVDTILGHPIMLTDVLEKVKPMLPKDGEVPYYYTLCSIWEPCGFTKSLQTILAEAEWEDIGHHTHNMKDCRQCANKPMMGNAKDLFEYLSSLFPET